MQLESLTIVGVGLIGGSIGLAAKQRGLARRVVGVGARQSTLNLAQDLGAIDAGFPQTPAAMAGADLVVFCTPVQIIADGILEAAPHCRPGTIITDTGSTKSLIVAALDGKLPPGVNYVGSHPLAGSEKRGPEYADPHLFEERMAVVTPTPNCDAAAVERVEQFWRDLGAHVKRMTPDEHDQALALTSHMPHLLASALAGVLPPELHDLTATGFWDSTRIASGAPDLWTGILGQNRKAVLEALDRLEEQIKRFRAALSRGDDALLTNLLEQGKKVRDALGS